MGEVLKKQIWNLVVDYKVIIVFQELFMGFFLFEVFFFIKKIDRIFVV